MPVFSEKRRPASRALQRALALTLLLGSAASAFAQQYPNRPVHVTVSTAPGGTADVTTRMFAKLMEPRLGQPVLVENRSGGGGAIAANYVRTAEPDGYNLLGGGSSANATFVKNNPVDPLTQLVPISNLSNGTFFVFVRASLPVKSMQELIAYSKANPNKLNFGESSPLTRLAVEAMKLKTGLSFTAIPYRGAAPMVPAFLADQVDFTIDSLPTFQPHIQSGKVRALISTSPKRSPFMPDIPSAAEVGITEYSAGYNFGLWAPLRTPQDIIQRLYRESAVVMKMPEIANFFRGIGVEPMGSTPEELIAVSSAYDRTYAEAAKASGFQPQ